MVSLAQPLWQPRKIRRVEHCDDTGTEVVRLVTDVGVGFAKFLGNREGPHVLACELMGTKLAALFGLPVFDHAVFEYDGFPEIRLYSGGIAKPGPAWITRREEGSTWSGKEEDLKLIANPEDLARLVVLDTWTRNCDRFCPARHPPRINRNNVFFSREGAPDGLFRLLAMDHTHTFTCGRQLTPALAQIDCVKDEVIYGLFPEFLKVMKRADLVSACETLAVVPDAAIKNVVAAIPQEWEVPADVRDAVVKFLGNRRDFLAPDLVARVFPQGELF